MGPASPGIHANALTGTHRAGSIHNQLDAFTTPASGDGAIETFGLASRLRTVIAALCASCRGVAWATHTRSRLFGPIRSYRR